MLNFAPPPPHLHYKGWPFLLILERQDCLVSSQFLALLWSFFVDVYLLLVFAKFSLQHNFR